MKITLNKSGLFIDDKEVDFRKVTIDVRVDDANKVEIVYFPAKGLYGENRMYPMPGFDGFVYDTTTSKCRGFQQISNDPVHAETQTLKLTPDALDITLDNWVLRNDAKGGYRTELLLDGKPQCADWFHLEFDARDIPWATVRYPITFQLERKTEED